MGEPLSGACVLVTGATGFLGAHLTRRLVAIGADVHAVTRQTGPQEQFGDVHSSIRWRTCDLRDSSRLTQLVDDVRPEVVYHLAGFTAARAGDHEESDSWTESYSTNLMGTLNLLLALRQAGSRVSRIVRTGGLEEYGDGPLPFREDQCERPVSAYSASQLAATQVSRLLHYSAGLPVVSLRPALMYGPGQPQTFFIPSLIASCLRHEPFDMTAGNQTRDLVFVSDVVDACIRAATMPDVDGLVINLGSGREHRIRDVAELVVRLAGSCTTLRFGSRPPRRSDLDRLVCDPELARRLLGWHASTNLETGIRQTIDWFTARCGA
jgi:UDP-glucose 4-epimerase